MTVRWGAVAAVGKHTYTDGFGISFAHDLLRPNSAPWLNEVVAGPAVRRAEPVVERVHPRAFVLCADGRPQPRLRRRRNARSTRGRENLTVRGREPRLGTAEYQCCGVLDTRQTSAKCAEANN